MDMNTDKQPDSPNRDLEIALVKIARALYDYTRSQDDPDQLRKIYPISGPFRDLVNDYSNATGRLHPDLGFELSEWSAFRRELFSPDHEQRKRDGKSGLTLSFVDNYGEEANEIIKNLEKELGIT